MIYVEFDYNRVENSSEVEMYMYYFLIVLIIGFLIFDDKIK